MDVINETRKAAFQPDGSVRPGHRLTVRVYYEDTDFSGFVYHGNFVRFLERGRTESLRAVGFDQSRLHAGGDGLVFVVRRITLDFRRPARMDDLLDVETGLADVRGASLNFAQRVSRDGETLVTADVQVAALSAGRPVRIPEQLRRALAGDTA